MPECAKHFLVKLFNVFLSIFIFARTFFIYEMNTLA